MPIHALYFHRLLYAIPLIPSWLRPCCRVVRSTRYLADTVDTCYLQGLWEQKNPRALHVEQHQHSPCVRRTKQTEKNGERAHLIWGLFLPPLTSERCIDGTIGTNCSFFFFWLSTIGLCKLRKSNKLTLCKTNCIALAYIIGRHRVNRKKIDCTSPAHEDKCLLADANWLIKK